MTPRRVALEEALVARALTGRALTLPELAVEIGGIYPADLKELLSRLLNRELISYADERYRAHIPQSAEQTQPQHGAKAIRLLAPHPANMDWRYEEGTARFIAERSLEISNGRGLLVGSPSALVHWRQLAPARPALLLDASEIMVSSINEQIEGSPQRAMIFDMCRPLEWKEEQRYDVCLCDPPWYREHYLGAIGIAASALHLGSKMLVSLLPMLARPAASADRHWVVQQAEQLGFHLVSLEQNILGYITPAFERQSLASAGIKIPAAWRRGDLATFVKVRDVDADIREATLTPLATLELVEREFSEILVRGQIWQLRGPFDDVGVAPALLSIEPNNVLSTVSRRYEGRNKIGLWLPDNRVFGVRGRAAFWGALTRLDGKGRSILSSASEDATIAEANQLLEPLLPDDDTRTFPQGPIA